MKNFTNTQWQILNFCISTLFWLFKMAGSPHWIEKLCNGQIHKIRFLQPTPTLYSMQVLCSWNLCNQPNHRTSFKSLKLGFAMGSLAEKLIHFVTKRSIHEFFSQLLTSLNFVAIFKGGLIMYLLLLKINLQNLKCRSY